MEDLRVCYRFECAKYLDCPRGIDVQPDVLLRIFGGKHQHLCADAIGHFILDFLAHPDDAVFEESIENRIDRPGRRILTSHDRKGCKSVVHHALHSNYIFFNISQTTAPKRRTAIFSPFCPYFSSPRTLCGHIHQYSREQKAIPHPEPVQQAVSKTPKQKSRHGTAGNPQQHDELHRPVGADGADPGGGHRLPHGDERRAFTRPTYRRVPRGRMPICPMRRFWRAPHTGTSLPCRRSPCRRSPRRSYA